MKPEEEMIAICAASDLLNMVLELGPTLIPIEIICEIYIQTFWGLYLVYN